MLLSCNESVVQLVGQTLAKPHRILVRELPGQLVGQHREVGSIGHSTLTTLPKTLLVQPFV